MSYNVVSMLKDIKNLLDKHQRWTKQAEARKSNGNIVNAISKDAVRYCLLGAFKKVKLNKMVDRDKFDLCYRLLSIESGGSIVAFNDNPNTKYNDVIELLDKVIETEGKNEHNRST